MFGPVILFRQAEYTTLQDGAERSYYARVPFAGTVKTLAVSVLTHDMPAAGELEIDVDLEESLDGLNWYAVETLTSTPINADGYQIEFSTQEFGAMARLVLKLAIKGGITAAMYAGHIEVRCSGKPF